MQKKALFRFETSHTIGAGHAIRSCVLADALKEKGWTCCIITSQTSYDFIQDLSRFERIDPREFEENPTCCDLLVIDHYGLGEAFETSMRSHAAKIMVIDDLADRRHDCDILLDQTYRRDEIDYKSLVPQHCKILTGSDYVLLRKDFILMRPKALQKRKYTKEVKRILVSMGGSDQGSFTIQALEMIKDSGFTGEIDIVIGFQAINLEEVKTYAQALPNPYTLHVNPNMAQLMYDADLAIGGAGSSVWERCCLGLPQVLIQTADNQEKIFENLKSDGVVFTKPDDLTQLNIMLQRKNINFFDEHKWNIIIDYVVN